jgi:hypothetical protein
MNEATVTSPATVQSGSIAFKPRARLLKLIGAELISDDVVAATELVKNAHDADASSVTIQFLGVTGADGQIIVRDDGDGMSLDALLRHWMEPAGTSKVGPKARRTRLGRRVLGEKGVGRFAADKLGAQLELISRRRGEKNEVRAVFEWDRFEDESLMLKDVESDWEVRPPSEIGTHGTVLRISRLRSAWSERMFRRLSARLGRLRSPFSSDAGFSINMESDEFPEYSGELRADFLDRAPYRIEAEFDGDETIWTAINGGRKMAHRWTESRPLTCGGLKIKLYAFDLETESIARIGPRMDVRAWLKEWSGVSVYRDGFRVWPYGEPHDDWLRLDQRRVNNPVVRLSNNQVVGFVELSADDNPALVDQTNREGLIHNGNFEDLRRLLHQALQTLEAERQLIRHPAVDHKSPTRDRPVAGVAPPVDVAFDRLAAKLPESARAELSRLRERVQEEMQIREDAHRRLEQGFAELAAVGQTALGITSTVAPILAGMVEECSGLIGTLQRGESRPTARRLKSVLDTARAVSQRLGMLTTLEGGAGGLRRRAIDVLAEVQTCRVALKPVLDGAGVRLLIDPGTQRVVRAEIRPENFHRALFVLVSSMVDGLRHVRHPEIRLLVSGDEDSCSLLIADNGPGTRGSAAQPILAALNGQNAMSREGYGMAAARNIVENHGGRMELVRDRRRKGLNIRVTLPRKRSRATM